jgi:hypothetical protein
MSDPFQNPIFGERAEPAAEAEVGGTGQVDVDAVVGSLSDLDGLPVAEHVAVFERAHESLRRTLVGSGHDSRGDSMAPDRN